jgi:hypothetical protein
VPDGPRCLRRKHDSQRRDLGGIAELPEKAATQEPIAGSKFRGVVLPLRNVPFSISSTTELKVPAWSKSSRVPTKFAWRCAGLVGTKP